jgi:hypothetical protein
MGGKNADSPINDESQFPSPYVKADPSDPNLPTLNMDHVCEFFLFFRPIRTIARLETVY